MAKSPETADELLNKMESERTDTIFVGLIKANRDDAATLLYSSTPDGSAWLPVPATEIVALDFLQDVRCGEQILPLARLQLRSGKKSSKALFMDLARHHSVVPLSASLAGLSSSSTSLFKGIASQTPADAESSVALQCGYVWTGSGYTYMCF